MCSNKHKKMSKYILILCVVCLFNCLGVRSQTYAPIKLPHALKESVYLVGSENINGELCFLSSEIDKKKKAKAFSLYTDSKGCVDANNECLWRLEVLDNNNVRLFSTDKNAYLCRVSDDKVGLLLSEDADSRCNWIYEINESRDAIRLYATADKTRQLAVDLVSDKSSAYDSYSTSYTQDRSLTLYKSTEVEQGGNTLPSLGQTLCLASADCAYLQSVSGSPISSKDAWLLNGQMAMIDNLKTWRVESVTDSCFSLKSNEGFLSYRLNETAEACLWKISNGYVCTAEAQPQYLAFSGSKWELVSDVSQIAEEVRLCEVASSPTKELDAQGALLLKGGWNALLLADLPLTDVRCLDLTHVSLPRSLYDFNNADASSNVPIFVNEEDKDAVPKSWRFVVSCGENASTLCDAQLFLIDKEPFYTNRDIVVAEGQVVYKRTGSPMDRWQTLSLPFDANIVSGAVYGLEKVEGETMFFEKANAIDAYCGYIVYPNKSGEVLLKSKFGVIACNSRSSVLLNATFVPYTVNDNNHNTYFLHPTEQCFKQTAKSSLLQPFRAYYKGKQSNSRMNVVTKRQ